MSFFKQTFSSLGHFFNPYRDTYNATPDNSDQPIPVSGKPIVDETYLAIVDETGNDIIWEL